jgi:hypothetical protein
MTKNGGKDTPEKKKKKKKKPPMTPQPTNQPKLFNKKAKKKKVVSFPTKKFGGMFSFFSTQKISLLLGYNMFVSFGLKKGPQIHNIKKFNPQERGKKKTLK